MPNSKRYPITDWQKHLADLKLQSTNPAIRDFYNVNSIGKETPLSEVPFVALDFETTGLNADKDEIISIGLVPFSLNRIYLSQSKQWLVKPRKKLNSDSVVIHGITHSELEDAPDLTLILSELMDCLAGKIVVVHYRDVERPFLDQALKRRLNEGIDFPIVDTLQIEWDIQQKLVQGLWNRLKGKKTQSVRLAASRERYNLPPYTPHDALVDAIATAELLQAQVYYHFSPKTPIKALWL
jgi:DNA polymerase-3 subunit epsilon